MASVDQLRRLIDTNRIMQSYKSPTIRSLCCGVQISRPLLEQIENWAHSLCDEKVAKLKTLLAISNREFQIKQARCNPMRRFPGEIDATKLLILYQNFWKAFFVVRLESVRKLFRWKAYSVDRKFSCGLNSKAEIFNLQLLSLSWIFQSESFSGRKLYWVVRLERIRKLEKELLVFIDAFPSLSRRLDIFFEIQSLDSKLSNSLQVQL